MSGALERADAARTRLGAASALVGAVGFVASGGQPGTVAAVATAVAWLALPPTYAFALGQVALATLVPDVGIGGLAAIEAGLFGVLLAPLAELDDPGLPVGIAVAGGVVGAALAGASAARSLDLAAAALLLVGATALVAYGVHRYRLVDLGLVEDDRE